MFPGIAVLPPDPLLAHASFACAQAGCSARLRENAAVSFCVRYQFTQKIPDSDMTIGMSGLGPAPGSSRNYQEMSFTE